MSAFLSPIRLGTAFALIIAFTLSSASWAKVSWVVFDVARSTSCGEWVGLEIQNTPGSKMHSLESAHKYISLQTWLLGFLNGVGESRSEKEWKQDPFPFMNWIDAYCASHTYETVKDAAGAMLSDPHSPLNQ